MALFGFGQKPRDTEGDTRSFSLRKMQPQRFPSAVMAQQRSGGAKPAGAGGGYALPNLGRLPPPHRVAQPQQVVAPQQPANPYAGMFAQVAGAAQAAQQPPAAAGGYKPPPVAPSTPPPPAANPYGAAGPFAGLLAQGQQGITQATQAPQSGLAGSLLEAYQQPPPAALGSSGSGLTGVGSTPTAPVSGVGSTPGAGTAPSSGVGTAPPPDTQPQQQDTPASSVSNSMGASEWGSVSPASFGGVWANMKGGTEVLGAHGADASSLTRALRAAYDTGDFSQLPPGLRETLQAAWTSTNGNVPRAALVAIGRHYLENHNLWGMSQTVYNGVADGSYTTADVQATNQMFAGLIAAGISPQSLGVPNDIATQMMEGSYPTGSAPSQVTDYNINLAGSGAVVPRGIDAALPGGTAEVLSTAGVRQPGQDPGAAQVKQPGAPWAQLPTGDTGTSILPPEGGGPSQRGSGMVDQQIGGTIGGGANLGWSASGEDRRDNGLPGGWTIKGTGGGPFTQGPGSFQDQYTRLKAGGELYGAGGFNQVAQPIGDAISPVGTGIPVGGASGGGPPIQGPAASDTAYQAPTTGLPPEYQQLFDQQNAALRQQAMSDQALGTRALVDQMARQGLSGSGAVGSGAADIAQQVQQQYGQQALALGQQQAGLGLQAEQNQLARAGLGEQARQFDAQHVLEAWDRTFSVSQLQETQRQFNEKLQQQGQEFNAGLQQAYAQMDQQPELMRLRGQIEAQAADAQRRGDFANAEKMLQLEQNLAMQFSLWADQLGPSTGEQVLLALAGGLGGIAQGAGTALGGAFMGRP